MMSWLDAWLVQEVTVWDNTWRAMDDNVGDSFGESRLSPGVLGDGFGRHDGRRRGRPLAAVCAQADLLGKDKVSEGYSARQYFLPLPQTVGFDLQSV